MQNRENTENIKHLLFLKRQECSDLQHRLQIEKLKKKHMAKAANRAIEINEQLLAAITEAGMYLDEDMQLQFNESAKEHLRDACAKGLLWAE